MGILKNQYDITPSIDEAGNIGWTLWRYSSMGIWGASRVMLASNRNRAVLEQAVAHLEGGAPKKNRGA